uniref:G-protein coupled receptors family 1 profile domain-containing protein n=1 Tax=Gopherus evgoodei TaxID=1825980 RepID=A0A8C4WLH3_9SAUR
MEQQNLSSTVIEFVLLGLTQNAELQQCLFVVFFIVYLTSWLGNFTIITTVITSHQLHTPMYFLLAILAFLDVSDSSVNAPKLLLGLLSQHGTILFNECILQMFFFHFFASAMVVALVIMAADRYVAIYKPLCYLTVMNRGMCVGLVAGVYGILYSALHTGNTFVISFCGGNRVDQFFCDIPQLLKLACSDSDLNESGVIAFSACLVLSCFVLIVVSYVQIFKTVLRIPSEHGRHKAFSTCLPHVTVVSLFIFSGIFAYLKPNSSSTSRLDLVVDVFYSVVPPMMNPIIYSMRNKEIKAAMRKLIGQRLFMINKMFIFLL